MPLPLILKKRVIARKDNATYEYGKNATSNNKSHSQTQTYARRTIHVQPKGIIFNYNIRKCSTHTTNENTSITEENQNDSHATTTESNAENNDNSVVDDSNIKPNKMYKIVIVDGNIRLAELSNADDIIEVNDEGNNEESDSDVEFIDSDYHVDVHKNKDGNLRKYELPKKFNTGSENETNMTPIKPMSVTKPIPIVSNQCENGTVSTILDHNLPSVPAKIYTQREGNESFMKKLVTVTDSNSSNNNIHTTKENLAQARNGKPMVLLPLQKYTNLKKKLAHIQKEKEKETEKWTDLQTKYIKEKLDQKKNVIKKDTKGIQTDKCHTEELAELNLLKTRLAKIFTEAQIDMIRNSKKARDIVWSDSEMEKVVFLKQIISPPAYIFLKNKMRFLLPPLSIVKQWMIKKNIYVQPSKKEKIKKQAENNPRMVGEELNLNTTQIPLPLEPVNPYVHDETQDIHSSQTQTAVSETAQAVNTIIDDQQLQDVEFGSTLQVYSTLSGPNDTGEQFVYYTYEDVNNENDASNANYLPVDNIATVEEVVQSEEVKPRRRNIAKATLRCRLCMRPFDTDQEIREHVPLHYANTYYTSYLDAVKPLVCEFCNEPVKHRFDLIRHHRAHLGIDALKCWFPGCTYVGKNMGSVKSHHDCHRAQSLKCEDCGALFKTRKYLYQHRVRRHLRPPSIKCLQAGCGKIFSSRASLRQHVSTKHAAAPRRYRCSLCPRAQYFLKAHLNLHLQKHETHKITHCVKCLKVFYDYSEFYAHYMEHKDSEPKCKCACGQRFFTQEQLGEHKLECTSVSGDNTKKNRKRKDKNAGNTEQADSPINAQKKRRKTINVKSSSTEQKSEKSYECNITSEQENTKDQVSEENQTFEQEKQEVSAVAPVIPEDITEKVITLQINNNQAVITLANNYPSITNNYTQVISTTGKELQNYILIPKRDQKVRIKSDQQLKVDANAGDQQQNVVSNAVCQRDSGLPMSDNPIQRVISNPENHFQNLIVMPKTYRNNVNSMAKNVSRNVVSVPENNLSESTPLSNQHNIVQVSPNEHKIKNIITENIGHYPKKLTPIAKGSILEKMIAMSTTDKIISGPRGKFRKKVLAFPINSLRKVIDSENPVQKSMPDIESPVQKLVTDSENPLQKSVTDSENPLQISVTDSENPVQKSMPDI